MPSAARVVIVTGGASSIGAAIRLITEWSNRMLQPPTLHMQAILHSAQHNPAIARRFVECFDDPPQFFPWLFEAPAAEALFGTLAYSAAAH